MSRQTRCSRTSRRQSFTLLALLAAAALPAAVSAQVDPEGHWEGEIRIPGSPLAVDVDLAVAEGEWTGDISIPAQGASDLPLTGIAVDGRSVRFVIQGVPGDPTFDGTLSTAGDTLAGQFTQGGGSFRFELTREAAPARRAREALQGLDEWMAGALEDFEVPGAAVGVLVDGEVVVARGFGYRDVARQLPVDEHTIFAIGSSTKAFTTFGLGRLVDEGRFDWDRPIREYLPGVEFSDPVATRLITPRDMVAHRTGLPRHDLTWYGWQEFTPEWLIDALPHLELSAEPRERWQYNNLMFVLAGHLLGRIHGGGWEAAITEFVLNPLGMDETSFDVEVSRQSPNHALPYGERGDTVAGIPFRDISPVGPAGSINSSVTDMLRWARVHVERGVVDGDTLISPVALREMHTQQMAIAGFPTDEAIGPMSYGLGWFIQPYRGKYRVHHGGNIDGFSALVTFYPFDRVGIVVLTNKNGTGLPELASRWIADRALGLETREWDREALQNMTQATQMQQEAESRLAGERIEGTRPDYSLSAYTGTYRNPGYGELSIDLDAEGRLAVDYHGLTAPLEHWHYEVFSALENPDDPALHRLKLQFESDLRGTVSGVAVPLEPAVDPIRFAKLPPAELRDPAYLARLAGAYALGPQTIRVTVRGETLVLNVPGQPAYELIPQPDRTFVIEVARGFWLEFELEDGRAETLVLHQPNGVFRAERQEDGDGSSGDGASGG